MRVPLGAPRRLLFFAACGDAGKSILTSANCFYEGGSGTANCKDHGLELKIDHGPYTVGQGATHRVRQASWLDRQTFDCPLRGSCNHERAFEREQNRFRGRRDGRDRPATPADAHRGGGTRSSAPPGIPGRPLKWRRSGFGRFWSTSSTATR